METIKEILRKTFKNMLVLSFALMMIGSAIAITLLIAAGWIVHWGWSVLGLFLFCLWKSISDTIDKNERFLNFLSEK